MTDVIAILEDVHLDYLTKYIILHDAMEELYADRDCPAPHPDLVSYDDRGFFPLLVAACLGSGDICAWLLERRCPVEQMVAPGHLAEHYVATPLHEVCHEGRLDLAELFRRYCTDFQWALHQENHLGMSAGHLAVKSGHPEMVRWVCEAGYDVRCLDHHGNSLLHYACSDDDHGSPREREEAPARNCATDFPVLSYLLSLDALSPLQRNHAGYTALHLVARQRFAGGRMLLILRRLSGKLNAFEEALLRCFVGAYDDSGCGQDDKSAEAVTCCRYVPGVLHGDILALVALSPVSCHLTTVLSYLERQGETRRIVRSVCEDEMLLSLVCDQISRIKSDHRRLIQSVSNVRVLLDRTAAASGVPLQRSGARLLREGIACGSPRLVKLALLHGASASSAHLSGYFVSPVRDRMILLLIAGGMDAEQVRYDASLDTRSLPEVPDLDYLMHTLLLTGHHRTVKRLIGDIKGLAHSPAVRSIVEQLASPARLEVLSARVVRRHFKDKVFWYANNLDVCDIIKTTLLLGFDVSVDSQPLICDGHTSGITIGHRRGLLGPV